jgi:diketogulonate reductase-like aldo/keto reductase
MKTFKLLNNIIIPSPGFGTWKLGGDEETVSAIRAAIDAGYRHFDTAASYGNETAVGEALACCGVNRSELFVSGKLWNTKREYSKVRKAYLATLKRLKLDYLDLYLIHWPVTECYDLDWKQRNLDVWKAFEELYTDGLVKAIGVSNFLPHHLEALLEQCEIKPMVNQLELHPGYYNMAAVELCQKNGILTEAWSPLGNGAVLNHPLILEIAKAHNKSAAQVCLKFLTQQGVLPVTKTSSPQRMTGNLQLYDFDLSKEESDRILSMEEVGWSGYHPDKINDFS